MAYTYVNGGISLLGAALDDADTTVTLPSGNGALFQGASVAAPIAAIISEEGVGTEGVHITDEDTDVLDITRAAFAVDGLTSPVALTFTTAAAVRAVVTKAMLREFDVPTDPFRRASRIGLLENDCWGATSLAPFNAYVSGTGGAVTANALTSNAVLRSQVELRAGTTTTGRAAIFLFDSSANGDMFALDGGQEWRAKFLVRPTILDDGTDTFFSLLGWGDNVAVNSTTDAVAFVHRRATSTTNWVAMCRSNGTSTYTDTGVALSTTTWQDLEIRVNAGATSVGFYIAGALVATITTNIPTTSSRKLSFGAGIEKTAGTNNAYFSLDYLAVASIHSTPRW